MRAALTDKASEGAIRNVRSQPQAASDAAAGQGPCDDGPRPRLCRTAARSRSLTRPARCSTPRWSTPLFGERQKKEAITLLAQLIEKHGVEHIAIGNGTASRETEQMTVELIDRSRRRAQLHDRERGGRVRLLRQQACGGGISRSSTSTSAPPCPSPGGCRTRLAELVKIDPKAIGVGQYQHDMPQKELDASPWTPWWRTASTPSAWTSTPPPRRCSRACVRSQRDHRRRTSSPTARRTARSPRRRQLLKKVRQARPQGL